MAEEMTVDNSEEIKETKETAVEQPVKKRRGRPPKQKEAVEAVPVSAPTPAPAKKEAAKKAPAKKVEPKTSVIVEFNDKQVSAKEVIAAATKAYKKANRGVVIKKLDVYVKPEENAAYYVVNGEGSKDFKIEL